MLQYLVLMVLFALLVGPIVAWEELRSVIRTSGVQSVIIPGATMMLKLSVLSLDIHSMVFTDYQVYLCPCIQVYVHAGAAAYSNAHFGQGSGGIFLSNVLCTGTESSLLDCPHAGIGVHTCRHHDDAGVSCSRMWYIIILLYNNTKIINVIDVSSSV